MYETIEFDQLNEDKFKEFIEKIDSNEMTKNLWIKLKKCFYVYKNSEANKMKDSYEINCLSFKYDNNENNAFNGIIRHLTKDSGGNLDEKCVIKITSSSIETDDRTGKNVVDLDNINNLFCTKDEQNSWIQFYFKTLKISPTHCSIKLKNDCSKGYYHPKSWILEGSNDGF